MASPSPSLDTSMYHCAVVLFRGRPHPTRVATSVILWDRDANHQTAYSCNTWSVNLSVFLTRAPVPFAEMISYKRSFRSDSATIISFFMFLIISAEKSTTVFFSILFFFPARLLSCPCLIESGRAFGNVRTVGEKGLEWHRLTGELPYFRKGEDLEGYFPSFFYRLGFSLTLLRSMGSWTMSYIELHGMKSCLCQFRRIFKRLWTNIT